MRKIITGEKIFHGNGHELTTYEPKNIVEKETTVSLLRVFVLT